MPSPWEILIAILLPVLAVILATVRWKLHPFISLLGASILAGWLLRLPTMDIMRSMIKGFGDMAAGIGIIIALGSMIGICLEHSGAATVLANRLGNITGRKGSGISLSCIGALVGIPVFCDSGFIMLSAPARQMARAGGQAGATLPLAAATGLYSTHVLVPPTPGPLAAAGNLGASDSLGMVILVGLLMSVPALLAGYAWARKTGPGMEIQDPVPEMISGTDIIFPEPGIMSALTPILLPVLLIMAGNVSALLFPGTLTGHVLQIAGQPIIALGAGLASCFLLFRRKHGADHAAWMEKAVQQAGPIVLITCAGGSFGAVLKQMPLESLISDNLSSGTAGSALLPLTAFVIAAILKTAQGSSTASMIITSSILVPFVQGMGIDNPVQLSLLVAAIGAGSMTVSHTNDSYFWVVSRFGGMDIRQTLRGFTAGTAWMGLAVILTTLLAWRMIAG